METLSFLAVTGLGAGEHINIILCVIIIPKAVQNPTTKT
jgi:hypothetical protein